MTEGPVEIAPEASGEAPLPGLLLVPDEVRSFYVFGHGAGAGMGHAFMESLAHALAAEGVATLRWEFPYMAAGGRRPDRPAVAVPAVRRAVAAGRRIRDEIDSTPPLFAGGKSFGGRMTSTAESGSPLPDVRGLVFVGFPLHPANRPGTTRADHLRDVLRPMLFLQGTRDALADLDLLRPVVEELGARATLHLEDDADHGFHVRKRSGRDDDAVIGSLAAAAAAWMNSV